MEIIESVLWVALGFVPTLSILEFVSRKSAGIIGVRTVRLPISAEVKG